MSEVKLNIPLGYRQAEKIKHVKIWDAEKILLSKKQRYYTEARRNGNDVELVESFFVCPYCLSETVSNSRYCYINLKHRYNGRMLFDEEIYEWSSLQHSFFAEDNVKTLHISLPAKRPHRFKCPKCKCVSSFSEKSRPVEMRCIKQKIQIKSEIINVEEMFSLKWTDCESVSGIFPMFETLSFDLKKGRVCVKLESNDGSTICHRDITDDCELLEGGTSYNLITFNKSVNRTIKRMFYEVWGTALPYVGKEITIENLFKMTMFVGYKRDFYVGIPYKLNSVAVDNSFKKNARQLHEAVDIVYEYAKSGLPQVKSLKRIFFNDTVLFFYLPEAKMLYDAMADLNIFCRFLKMPCVYEVLSDIHMRPGIITYFKDYCSCKGAVALLKKMDWRWGDMREAAIDYFCMNPDLKEKMKMNWIKKTSIASVVRRSPHYSVPMQKPEEGIKDCTVDGYEFFWLRNSKEYMVAGKNLSNCLSRWNSSYSPVVCVKKGQSYVAAIQISDGLIVQAYGPNNTDIGCDSELKAAYEKWMKIHKLEEVKCDDNVFDNLFDEGGVA